MKTWFVYLINGIKIGTWANNNSEAERNLIAEYGDVPMEFVGMDFGNIGVAPDKITFRNMSTVDRMIASGCLNTVC